MQARLIRQTNSLHIGLYFLSRGHKVRKETKGLLVHRVFQVRKEIKERRAYKERSALKALKEIKEP